eukprot:gene17456-19203_t
MATHWRLQKQVPGAISMIYSRNRMAEEARQREFRSAIKIQSWFRGERVRSYMRYLNDCAITIQKNYRAHVDRAIYRELVHNELIRRRKIYYNKMATKIQTSWRGYYIRKYIFNYYARKKYLDALVKRNEIVRRDLDAIANHMKAEQEREKNEIQQREKEMNARRHHYLISTEVKPGIYASTVKGRQISSRERELRKAKPLSTLERRSLEREKLTQSYNTGIVDLKSLESDKLDDGQFVSLPPIPPSKPQGPFREPMDVFSQRFKPLEPSLRVATSYTSVEDSRSKLKAKEWTKRVIEKEFLPFTKKQERYQPLLDTRVRHERPAYGTKHFRDIDDPKKTIHQKDFQRFVSPIPVFEKLGKTY